MNYEVSRTTDQERLQRLRSLTRHASEFVPVDPNVRDRATELQESLGIKSYDAFHIACAEEAGADVFLSTDDKLISAAKPRQEAVKVKIENPLMWLQSVVK